jgi:hypothetical protein
MGKIHQRGRHARRIRQRPDRCGGLPESGLGQIGAMTAKRGPRSIWPRRSSPRLCYWIDGPTNLRGALSVPQWRSKAPVEPATEAAEALRDSEREALTRRHPAVPHLPIRNDEISTRPRTRLPSAAAHAAANGPPPETPITAAVSSRAHRARPRILRPNPPPRCSRRASLSPTPGAVVAGRAASRGPGSGR